jgi:hypothetical protein
MRRMLEFRSQRHGYPGCHVNCARNYWMVVWDLGSGLEMSIKVGLN